MLLTLASLGFAREPVRLAITGDPAFAQEADLLTAELSKTPELVLLERQQISKMADEHALQTATDGLKLGQLLGADGLLILSRTEVNGHALLGARLVAVHPGVVIDEWTSPPYDAAEGRALVAAFSHRITSLLAKLRVAKKDAIPVSVAGLFAAVDSPALRQLERELTWLLVHRLTQEPTLFVLERRRMEDLAWEKTLTASEREPLMSGAIIVEGKLEERDGRLDLALGLRRPGDKMPAQSSVSGQAKDLPAFAEKILGAILDGLKLKPSVQRWNLADEAAFYADQAEWAMNHRLVDLCIASAESAWAMGRRDLDLACLRVTAYSLAAYPVWSELPGDFASRSGTPLGATSNWELDVKDRPRALAAAIRALEISAECLPAQLPPSRREGRTFRPVAAQALFYASRLIGAHFVSQKYAPHAPQLNSLRSLARNVFSQLSNSPEPREPYDTLEYAGRKDSHTFQAAAAYAPFWFDTNEQVLACLYQLLKPVPLAEKGDAALRDSYHLVEAWNPRASLVPWVVAWNPAENQARQMDMLSRLKRLTESQEFDDQAVGWASLLWMVKQAAIAKTKDNSIRWPQDFAAVLAGTPTSEHPKNLVKKGVLDFLWNAREKICNSCQMSATFMILGEALRDADHDYQLRYLRYTLEAPRHFNWYLYGTAGDNLELNPAERAELEQFCTTARDKAQARGDFDGKEQYLQNLNYALREIVKASPPSNPAQTPAQNRPSKPTPAPQSPNPPLIVSRYWYPAHNADAPKLPSGRPFISGDSRSLNASYAEGKLWFVVHEPGVGDFLGSVALDSFRSEYHSLPRLASDFVRAQPLITKDSIYLLKDKESMKWDRLNQRWRSLSLPAYPYRGRLLGDSLYLYFESGRHLLGVDLTDNASDGSGILRLDLRNDKPSFLASSRRRPAETRLDACAPYIPLAVFSGQAGALSAVIEYPPTGERKIFQATPTGNWQQLMDLPLTKHTQFQFRYLKDGVLANIYPAYDPLKFFQCVLFGTDGQPVQVLLSDSKPSDPPGSILPGPPRWDLPANLKPLRYWNVAFDYSDGCLYQLKMLEDDLDEETYTDKKAHTPDLTLRVYTPASRLPVVIPLRFLLSEADKSKIVADYQRPTSLPPPPPLLKPYPVKKLEIVSGMKVVPEGIVFYAGDGIGFWLLPKAQLDARLLEGRNE